MFTFDEIYALQDFYNTTNGSDWIDQTNWSQLFDIHDNSSGTYNFICEPGNIPFGLGCKYYNETSQYHITSMTFNGNRLSGTLPPRMHFLSYLHHFEILCNIRFLFGEIPETIYTISSVETFMITGCPLHGSISNKIIYWKNTITEVYLRLGNYTGNISSTHSMAGE